jgi:hypothetical protein
MSGPENVTPPPGATPPPAPEQAPSGPSSTSQATEMVGSAVSAVRERLVAGEQLLLVAAATIVVIVFFVFQFLLNYFIFADPTVPVTVAALTVVAIWIHRWNHHDFGSGYRIVVGALGLSLALFAVINLLGWARAGGGSGDFLALIGRLIYWVAGIAAGYGAWMVFRSRVS